MSPLTQFSKLNNFLWVCWFLGKNLSNFVPSDWKLYNPYYHRGHCLSHLCFPLSSFGCGLKNFCFPPLVVPSNPKKMKIEEWYILKGFVREGNFFVWSLKHKNTQPRYIFSRENPQNSEPQNGPRRGLDFIALSDTV